MKAVYLSGPINGCSDEECKGWRARARLLLQDSMDVCDPTDMDFRGREHENAIEIVRTDTLAIGVCDYVLANACRPSWGTAMEIQMAWDAGKGVVAFSDAKSISPWLTAHTHAVLDSLEAAVVFVMNFKAMAGGRRK